MSFHFGLTVYETIKIKKDIKSFINKATLNEEISTETIKYYEVSRETYYPNEYEREPFYDNDLTLPGSEGDILVTQKAPFSYLPGIYEFISFFFGGHSVYIGSDDKLYQTLGFPEPDESLLKLIFKGGKTAHASKVENYWLDSNFHTEKDANYKKFGSYYRDEWIGLRIKNVSKEEVYEVTSILDDLVERKAPYNFLFIFFTNNKYYCTDLITRPYSTITNSDGEPKYNLNKDGFAVTVNDLIVSSDTYISYYVKTDKYGIKHIYYIK